MVYLFDDGLAGGKDVVALRYHSRHKPEQMAEDVDAEFHCVVGGHIPVRRRVPLCQNYRNDGDARVHTLGIPIRELANSTTLVSRFTRGLRQGRFFAFNVP
jgi:hypothetical protein